MFFALLLGFSGPPAIAQQGGAVVDSNIAPAGGDTSRQQADPFQVWLGDFRRQAAARGISAATLDAALGDLRPLEQVLEFDRRQPEFIDTFWNYLNARVSASRLAAGREMLAWHQTLLSDVEQRYGIPARYLVALWGLESNYGSHQGQTPVVAALATLAFDARRAEFFRGELLAALRILDQGHATPATLLGSWAGAMGQMQFMPSTFLRHAVDADGDGRKDLWGSLPDALHSAANYLRSAGWRADEGWGREVVLPAGFDLRLASLVNRKSLREWAALGVLGADGEPLPDCAQRAALLLPQGHQGPAFLVQHNFEVILDWNRSLHYALAVGHLADRLLGEPPLRTGQAADNRRLNREQAIQAQQALTLLGYDPGPADGVAGSRTRTAIRSFQTDAGLPPDGHLSVPLWEHLQTAAAQAPAPAPAGTPSGAGMPPTDP
jgi:membrane-bound lytic murein transglycosylase B